MNDDRFPTNAWSLPKSQKALANTLCMNLYDVPVSLHSENTEKEVVSSTNILSSLAKDINDYFESLDFPWISALAPQFGIYRDENGLLCLRGLCRYGSSVSDEWRSVIALLDFTRQHSSSKTMSIVAECWDEDDGPLILIQAADFLPSVLSEGSITGGRYRSWIRNGQIYFILDTPDKELSLDEALSVIRQQKLVVANQSVQREVLSTSSGTDSQHWQRTVVVVRKETAALLKRHDGLIHAAIEKVVSERYQNNSSTNKMAEQDHEKVWVPVRMGRTPYAILRSAMQDDSFIYYEMGELIERGVSAVLRAQTSKSVDRMAAWQEMIGNNLTHIEDKGHIDTCPVFDCELATRQFHCVEKQLQDATDDEVVSQLQTYDGSRSPVDTRKFDIDAEDWIFMSEEDVNRTKQNGVSSVHKGLNAFFTSNSSTDGVHGKAINYGKVLRVLRTTLSAISADELQYRLNSEFDPFFSREDYELVSPDNDDQDVGSMENAMHLMDSELNRDQDDRSAISVMSSLLRSLESGGPGPARHLLNEMNQTAPNVTENDFSDE